MPYIIFIVACLVALLCAPARAFPTHSNSLGMEFQLVPAGTFQMGVGHSDTPRYEDEQPAHTVTVSKSFYLGKYEVTQAQWRALMGSNPSQIPGDEHPVENVSWDDAQAFIRKLNEREKTDKYRLPTEAEWEFAVRAGTQSPYFFGNDASNIVFYTWYNFDSGGSTHPVGLKRANAFGLHDMQGNVSEWVMDRYEKTYYSRSPETDPQGPATGDRRGVRGCSWNHGAELCRSASRLSFPPHEKNGFIGFRVLREIELME